MSFSSSLSEFDSPWRYGPIFYTVGNLLLKERKRVQVPLGSQVFGVVDKRYFIGSRFLGCSRNLGGSNPPVSLLSSVARGSKRESGVIGSHAGSRIQSVKGWEFESPLSHKGKHKLLLVSLRSKRVVQDVVLLAYLYALLVHR